MSVEAEVVVIGRARQGKSFVGNSFDPEDDSEDDEPEQTFKTKEGIESCTSEIKSVLFKKVEVPGTGKAVDLRYTDTQIHLDFPIQIQRTRFLSLTISLNTLTTKDPKPLSG